MLLDGRRKEEKKEEKERQSLYARVYAVYQSFHHTETL